MERREKCRFASRYFVRCTGWEVPLLQPLLREVYRMGSAASPAATSLDGGGGKNHYEDTRIHSYRK